MSATIKPRVFVGSSREGLEIARALQFGLRDAALVTVWTDGVFGLSEGTLEALVRTCAEFDFAALVVTPDDVVLAGEDSRQTPRDNVMFELGLFMGSLGRHRTFAVCSDSPGLKLPSDLAGVTMARFSAGDASCNLLAALGPACYQIRTAVQRLGPRPDRRQHELEVSVVVGEDILSAVRLLSLQCEPAQPVRGDTLTLAYALESTRKGIGVWLGANLERDSKYIYDVTQDVDVVLDAGHQIHQRYLTIPTDILPGSYALQVEVWFGRRSQPDHSMALAHRWPDRVLEIR
jgi:hypothetical protein